MKKIIKKFCRFIGKILQFFDKILVTPIMKLVMSISEALNGSNKLIEKVLMTKEALLVVSLLIALVAFVLVDKTTNIIVNKQAEILYNQPVTAIYNNEAYVVEGLPESVDVILVGSKSHIYLAKQQPSQEISIDLREYGVGTHKVALKYRETISAIEYKIDPSVITIVISDKESASREVTYEILHRDNLDSTLDIASVTLNKSEVTIKGSKEQLSKVAYVKALIDVDNLVNPVAGTTTIKGVKLVAYDVDGKMVNVEILPDTLEATLKIVSSSKSVAIKVVPEGNLALGYAITDFTLSDKSVTVYGSEEMLSEINSVEAYVDVSNLQSDKEFTVNLTKPTGARELSLNTIKVKVKVGTENQKTVNGIVVQSTNLDPSLKVNAVSQSDQTIDVIVKGTKDNLSNLDESKISAVVDLSEYTKPGEYEVEINVTGEDLKLSYTSQTKKIKIRISAK